MKIIKNTAVDMSNLKHFEVELSTDKIEAYLLKLEQDDIRRLFEMLHTTRISCFDKFYCVDRLPKEFVDKSARGFEFMLLTADKSKVYFNKFIDFISLDKYYVLANLADDLFFNQFDADIRELLMRIDEAFSEEFNNALIFY